MYLHLVCTFPCDSCACGVVLTCDVSWCGVAVSLNEDVDTNKELVAHGYSNLIAGFVGTVYVLFSITRLNIVLTLPMPILDRTTLSM